MKKFACLLIALLAVSVLSLPARADLTGASVDGVLNFGGYGSTNFYDPINGGVPGGYGNSSSPNGVIIGGGTEFGYLDGYAQLTANFTGSSLLLQEIPNGGGCCTNSWVQTFTITGLTGAILLSTNFGGLGYSVLGNVLTVTYAGDETLSGDGFYAEFGLEGNAVPEPASLMLLGTGLVGLAGRLRKKLS